MLRIFRSKGSHSTWVVRNVIGWGERVLSEINIRLKTHNREILDNIDWRRNVFLVANHQSYADIPAIYAASQRVFGFIAKYELKRIPFLHFWMKEQGCLFINRVNFVSAVKSLKTLEKRGKSNKLAIFAEGTRSKNGRLGPFKSGALSIAWQLDGLLLPIIISGTRQAWEDRQKITGRFAAAIRFGGPIDLKEIKKNRTFKTFLAAFEKHFHALHELTEGETPPPFQVLPPVSKQIS